MRCCEIFTESWSGWRLNEREPASCAESKGVPEGVSEAEADMLILGSNLILCLGKHSQENNHVTATISWHLGILAGPAFPVRSDKGPYGCVTFGCGEIKCCA